MTPSQFKQIRYEAKLTLSQLSKVIGVNERTIRRMENGTAPIHEPVAILMNLIHEGRL